MADTFTPKLGLRQYDAALNYQVSKFSADNLLIDNAIGTVICTSTTRPSTGLYNGMTLWETDTQRFVVRVGGSWQVASSVVTIANAAARTAIVTPYDGMTIYRQDFDWVEVYDGTAWRVQGHVVTTALANITNPITGQTCTLSTDSYKYRWTGSAWSPYTCINSNNTAEFSRTTVQSLGSGAVSRIDFTTTDKSSADITKSTVSGGSEFNINRAGRWGIETHGAITGNTLGTLRAWWIGRTTDTPRHAISGMSPGPSNFFHAFSIYKEISFAVNDKFCIFAYQDCGSALNTEIGQSTVGMTARWLGPQ